MILIQTLRDKLVSREAREVTPATSKSNRPRRSFLPDVNGLEKRLPLNGSPGPTANAIVENL